MWKWILEGGLLFLVVGLPDAAVQESRERCGRRSKIRGSIFLSNESPSTLPGHLRKEGPAYDLPIAVGVLVASEQITADVSDTLIIGELSLGRRGAPHERRALDGAPGAAKRGIKTLFVPAADAPEAALIPDLDVIPIESLFAVYAHLADCSRLRRIAR